MLSLANAFDIKDMSDFIKKVKNFLNTQDNEIEIFQSQKLMVSPLH